MSKESDAVWELLEDLDDNELATVGAIIAGLNQLEMVGEAPKYSTQEMDLIGRFKELDLEPDDDSDDKDEALHVALQEDAKVDAQYQAEELEAQQSADGSPSQVL